MGRENGGELITGSFTLSRPRVEPGIGRSPNGTLRQPGHSSPTRLKNDIGADELVGMVGNEFDDRLHSPSFALVDGGPSECSENATSLRHLRVE